MAQDRKVLGPIYHYGRIRVVRRHGSPLATIAGDHPEQRKGERHRRALATR